jgi:serine/threonine-protein kinase RsbW
MELQTQPRGPTNPGIRWSEQVVIPAIPQYVSMVRKRVVQLVTDVGFGMDAANEIAVAVSEAVSNAIEHAQPEGEATVDVRCLADAERVQVIVGDRGKSQWDPADVPPESDPVDEFDILSHRGRGVAAMRAFMDDVTFYVTPAGTEVHLTKYRHAPLER